MAPSRRNMIGASVAASLMRGAPALIVALCEIFEEEMERAKKSIGVESLKLGTVMNNRP